jgi:hypothetical protein
MQMFDNFHSYVYEPRKLEATEARLQRIYDAAKLGLKGDTLALAAGMRPTEYRQLTQLDPIAEYAEQKGKADGEMELSAILHKAAADGDAKAALEILKHQHGWVAKQQLSIDVEQRIYDAAKLGLKGDTLALAAGMRPTEYRQLTQLDPIAEYAEQKGKADGEMELSTILHKAAADGDAKAALEILKHQHGWVAKQQLSIDVEQRISITAALEQAQQRVIEGAIINKTLERANDQGLLINNRNEDGNDYTDFNPKQAQRVA